MLNGAEDPRVPPADVAAFQSEMRAAAVDWQLVHYGKMSIDAANLGWISQHEVNFTIPLAWYEEKYNAKGEKELVFKDWVYLTPYVFVDALTVQLQDSQAQPGAEPTLRAMVSLRALLRRGTS